MSAVEILRAPPRFSLEEIRRAVGSACERAGATGAVLFGSYARGEADRWSDIDLLLVVETEIPFLERFRIFPDLLDRFPGVELLVYTAAELHRRPRSGLLSEIGREGVLLWGERPEALQP